jgi:hypothetical protein
VKLEHTGLWARNAALIRTLTPGLIERITDTPRGEGVVDVKVETAASGEPTLVAGGMYVHSQRDPAREAARLAAACAGSGVIVALGFGLGYAVIAAAELCGNSRPVIIVEKRPEILKKAFETRDFTGFLAKNTVVCMIGGAEDAIFGALSLFSTGGGHKGGGDICIMRNRALVRLDEQWYAGVERRIRTWTTRETVNEATFTRFGARWARNFTQNAALSGCIGTYPGVSRLKGLLRHEIPVLLVAAGPSLDRIASLMPAFAERCAVVSVDTSLNYLIRAGVDPDWTVSGDPQYWNSRHLDRLSLTHTCLVTESAIYPLTLRYGKRTFLFATRLPHGKRIEEQVDPKGELGSGGSVATTAFDFCLELDPSVIFIAGLDLAFPHYKTHFKDAFFEKQANARATRLCPAETGSFRALRDGAPFYAAAANGGSVLTDTRLSLYAAWFENRLFSLSSVKASPDRKPVAVYSLSEEGLAIRGLETAGADAVLALPPRGADIRSLIRRAFERIERDFAAESGARRERLAAATGAGGSFAAGYDQEAGKNP